MSVDISKKQERPERRAAFIANKGQRGMRRTITASENNKSLRQR